MGEEIWVDSRTVYIGHKEPPPGAEAYIPQRYPDNRIVSSKVSELQLITHSPSVAGASPYCLLSRWVEFLGMIHYSRVSLPVFAILIALLFCPTVYPVELHPQESVWAVQKNRKLLLPGHISSPGESKQENQICEENLIRSFFYQSTLFLLAHFFLI